MSSSSTGMVRYRLDPDNPPQMTEEQLQALREYVNSQKKAV